MQKLRSGSLLVVRLLVALCVLAATAGAENIAVFGDNYIDDVLAAQGHTVTLVSDAQLATPGFLSSFAAFFMTRQGASFGTGLSAAAAAQVTAYVGLDGSVVLLNGDFADSLIAPADPNIQQLILNAANVAASSGHGFIGEYNGAVSGLTSNSDGLNPLSLIPGAAGKLDFMAGGSGGSMYLTPVGIGHAVTAGVAFPDNPDDVEFGASISGVDSAMVLARWGSSTGNPAIIARVVPEPGSILLLATFLAGAGVIYRRRRA